MEDTITRRLLLQQQLLSYMHERERRRVMSQLASIDVTPRLTGSFPPDTSVFGLRAARRPDLGQQRLLQILRQSEHTGCQNLNREIVSPLPRLLVDELEPGQCRIRHFGSPLSTLPSVPLQWGRTTLPVPLASSLKDTTRANGVNAGPSKQNNASKVSQDRETSEPTSHSERTEEAEAFVRSQIERPPSTDAPDNERRKGKAVPKSAKKDSKWLASLEELKAYKLKTGNCIVPRGYAGNPRLASWVAEQRKQYKLMKDGKQSSITQERVALLNDIGFAWNAQEAIWQERLKELSEFKQTTGHTLVPLNHVEYPKLGLWIKEQRRHYSLLKQGKPSHMTQERIDALNSIGFCWDTHEAVWYERLGELAEYASKFGSCAVPTNYPENPRLGTWVHHQRRQYRMFQEGKPSHITPLRIEALENIGFLWFPRGKRDATESGADAEDSGVDLRPKKRQRA